MGREESIEDIVKSRNKRLLHFFTIHGYDVRIVGDEQKPAIVIDDMVVLSCYVRNFDLYFTKEPFSEEIVRSFKLKADNEVSKLELQEAIELSSHRPVYKIRHIGTEMYLVGYNYLNSDESMGRYPVFGKNKPKVYFDKEYADKLVEDLKNEDYLLEVV